MSLQFPQSYVDVIKNTVFANDVERLDEPRNRYLRKVCRGRILDIGSNDGYLSLYFPNYTGIELNRLALQTAKKHRHGHFVNGLAEILPFKDEIFDSVICSEIIEHSVHPQKILDECQRVLKYQGRLFITTPTPVIGYDVQTQIITIPPFDNKDHIHEFHPFELYNMCAMAKLIIQKMFALETYAGRLSTIVVAQKVGFMTLTHSSTSSK